MSIEVFPTFHTSRLQNIFRKYNILTIFHVMVTSTEGGSEILSPFFKDAPKRCAEQLLGQLTFDLKLDTGCQP